MILTNLLCYPVKLIDLIDLIDLITKQDKIMAKKKKWIMDAINEFQIDTELKDGVEIAKVMKDALERPTEYILTIEQCKALLSLIATGKKHVVSKTSDDGVKDIALRPSLYLRMKALETLCATETQNLASLPVLLEVYPVASAEDVARLKDSEQEQEHGNGAEQRNDS